MRPGHRIEADGRSHFRVFAPLKSAVHVTLPAGGKPVVLARDGLGWWHGDTAALPAGTRYWIEADGVRLPDPASRCQPDGVHGPSAVVHEVGARSPGWRGVAIADALVYELHLGSFTPEGTLAAAQGRLPYLRALGITVVELMPLASFPGRHNWGYDGTFPYALHPGYGTLAELAGFIEAAHRQGLAVILDVVYNHFGPEGHYADQLAPYTQQAATPWGAAVNFDGPWNHGIRDFFLDNLRFWLEDVGFDGLRMDAVSLVFDLRPVHILRECTALARAIGERQGRTLLMIAEHLRNDRFVTADAGFGFQSQWNDDLHHALYAALTGESWRHYANFGAFDDVAKALADGFVLDGSRLCQHYRWPIGTDGRLTAATEHVVHIQNHDQVGNRPQGDRMLATHGRARYLLALTAVLASPFVPMLFMGEEYGETAPFPFFADFGDAGLVDAVRRGRQAEFAAAGLPGAGTPDPCDPATFAASKLDWSRAASAEGQAMLALVRQLLAWKRSGVLGPRDRAAVQVQADAATRTITLRAPRSLTVLNLSDAAQRLPATAAGWRLGLATLPLSDTARLPAFGAAVFVTD